MVVIAAVMFFQYSYSQKIIFLVLMVFAMGFVAIYFYRIFVMKIIFEDDRVTFKGLSKKYTINKKEVYDIQILKQVGKEVNSITYVHGEDYKVTSEKFYVMIRKNKDRPVKSLSMFNAANEDYIALEYVPGIEYYLDKLLDRTNNHE